MTEATENIMSTLYGYSIWDGFQARPEMVDHQGFNGQHASLSRLTEMSGHGIVVDVGVWKGQSTITLAKAMKSAGIDGCVIAVDTFLGSAEHWKPGQEMFKRSVGVPSLYEIFLNNVCDQGVKDYIVPMPQTSISSAMILHRLGIEVAIAHIDAAHEYNEVYRDAEEFWKVIRPGGYLIGDDFHPTWPGVVKAATDFSKSVDLTFEIEPPKWILQKPEAAATRRYA